MKRFFLVSLTILSMLAAVYLVFRPASEACEQTCGAEQYLDQIKMEIDREDTKIRILQRNLAKWYNRNLHTSEPEPGFETAYREILWYTDGIMGFLQFPGQAMPIYHQGTSGAVPGASHQRESELPIGGRGNHSILVLPGELDPGLISENLTVAIFCLGRTLVYRVEEPDTPEADLLTLIFPDGTKEILLRRSDAVTIQREQEQAAGGRMAKLALTGAVLCCALPVFAGIMLQGLKKLRRGERNYRKIQEISDS